MLFAHLVRRKDPFEWTLSAADEPGDPTVPRGFEPVADALLNQGDVEAAAVETGRDLAADGVPLDELLTDLEVTYAAAGLGGPDAGPDGGEQRVWIERLPAPTSPPLCCLTSWRADRCQVQARCPSELL